MTGPIPRAEAPDPSRLLERLRASADRWRHLGGNGGPQVRQVGDELVAHFHDLDVALQSGLTLPPDWAHAPAPADPDPATPSEEIAAARRAVTAALEALAAADAQAAAAAAERRTKARALGVARRDLHDKARLNDLSRP